ncbi:DUF4148 domain-containing protein [Paraburkholderia sp. CNPSo 3274]|uniref:DUF4148 domain-containing protein n=1 Tax=Paraburkholderia sp. CNPSo 3274 TaxID=2940932 RepID=UPI0020B891B0|nr:DUF4148 domain-containing protein [Paraburkholderia sp. CNPSo 3274]MCP3706843.1 DUF4148 domain-containing protein [Paraburkholderia sp. CNPSo 3274]
MKKSVSLAVLLVSAAAVLATAPAFAGGDTPTSAVQSLPVAAVATNNAPKTRAEVKAELASARAHGELSLDPNSPAYPQQYAMGGYTAPREQATAGFFHARSAAN